MTGPDQPPPSLVPPLSSGHLHLAARHVLAKQTWPQLLNLVGATWKRAVT